jgi:hypothetical protein
MANKRWQNEENRWASRKGHPVIDTSHSKVDENKYKII